MSIEEETINAVKEGVRQEIGKLINTLKVSFESIIWEVANNYIENHLEIDVFMNYREHVRNELIGQSINHMLNDSHYWGRKMRDAIYEEHKEELTKLIQNDQIKEMQNAIKCLSGYR